MPDDREHRFRQLYHEHYRTVQAYAVRRVAAGQLRTARRFRRLISRIENNLPAAPVHSEFHQNEQLFTALSTLPPGEREALLLVTWEQPREHACTSKSSTRGGRPVRPAPGLAGRRVGSPR